MDRSTVIGLLEPFPQVSHSPMCNCKSIRTTTQKYKWNQ